MVLGEEVGVSCVMRIVYPLMSFCVNSLSEYYWLLLFDERMMDGVMKGACLMVSFVRLQHCQLFRFRTGIDALRIQKRIKES